MLDILNNRPNNEAMENEYASKENSKSFTGSESYEEACKFMCEKSKDREYLTKLFDKFAADGVKGMAIFHNGSITNCIIMKDSTQDTSYYNTLYSIFINNFKL